MGYADEELLKIKNQEKAQAELELTDQENAEQEVNYERRYFLDGKVSMEVPYDCKEVTKETIQFVFYGENKPQFVIESESTEVAFGYNYTEMEIGNDDIFRFAAFASKILETAGPGVKIYKVKNDKRDNFNLSIVEFTSKGLDGGIYNQMFYVSLEGKLLINFVILPSKSADKKREIANHIVKSFQIETKED